MLLAPVKHVPIDERLLRPVAMLRFPPLPRHEFADAWAIRHARRQHRRAHAIQNSLTSGTVSELMFENIADYTALASFTSEANLTAGLNLQPTLPGQYFHPVKGRGMKVTIRASGIIACTGTPTYQFFVRLNTTANAITGTQAAKSAAITMQNGVSNQHWELVYDLTCRAPGLLSTNCTLNGHGWVESPGGFASPFKYGLTTDMATPQTWNNIGIDGSVAQYVTISVVCSANSASNTITCKSLTMHGWN